MPTFVDDWVECKSAVNATYNLQVISGKGKFYNFHNDERDYMYNEASYRHLLISGNDDGDGEDDDRLKFYQPCWTHALSEVNAEMVNARKIDLYGLSNEGNTASMWISNSSDLLFSR